MVRRFCALFACVSISALTQSSAFASETVNYSYDARGRMTQVDHSGTVNNGVTAGYGYDAADNRSGVTVSGGGLVAAPAFAVADTSITEGGTLVFTVSRTGATSTAQSVSYATASHTATSGADFTGTSGTLNFAIGDTSKTVSVATIQDSVYEGDEKALLNLSAPTNGAEIGDPQGEGKIVEDDAQISFSIADTSVTEGSPLVFTVTKTGATSATYTVDYAASNGTAYSNDYTATSGTLTFASSDTTKTISVPTTNDTAYEAAETVLVTLSAPSNMSVIGDGVAVGTINDNDAPPPQTLWVEDTSTTEGFDMIFTVSRGGSSSGTITVNYATANGTAGAGDYTATSGTLTFGPGVLQKTVTVTTKTDIREEGSEYFYLNLSSASGATITDSQGVGTIADNYSDPCPSCLVAGPPPQESSTTEVPPGGMN